MGKRSRYRNKRITKETRMEKYYDINFLTTEKENQYFERKSARKEVKDMLQHIVAFANAEGGVLAIGIEDDGRITGLKMVKLKILRVLKILQIN